MKFGRLICVGVCLAVATVGAGVYVWPTHRPNVLVITLDTTRADHLGCYGYGDALTPALDALAQQGTLFERAYATAPLTLPSHTTMFTGLHPAEHGVRTNLNRLPGGIPVLAELLASKGYETGAFVSTVVLTKKFGLSRGFQAYDDDLNSPDQPAGQSHKCRSGNLVVDAALDWLGRKGTQPFFCWVHLFDAHWPYQSRPREFGARFENAPYDGGIAFGDSQVARLVDFLDKRNLRHNTLIVIVGDHGEGLGDHQELAHAELLYDSTLHVPLIIANPEKSPIARRVPSPVSLVDLFPTILDCLHIEAPSGIRGQSLEPALRGELLEPSFCYAASDELHRTNGWAPLRSLTLADWKYIRSTRPELYHLRQDPHELRDLAASDPDRLREMESIMAEWEASLQSRDSREAPLSGRDQRLLTSLGYAASPQESVPGNPVTPIPDVKDMLPYIRMAQEAERLYEQGESDLAMEKLLAASAGAPTYLRPRFVLASLLMARGRSSDAEAVYRAILTVRPDTYHAHWALGGLFATQSRTAEAFEQYAEALRIEPEAPEAHNSLGDLYLRQGQTEPALRHLKEAVRLDPDLDSALVRLGVLFMNQGRWGEASAQLESALRANPNSTDAHANLGLVHANQGNFDLAVAHFEEATRRQPENAVYRSLLDRARHELSQKR